MMLLQGERTQSERWMDKVEKAEGVNRKFWSAYKSDSAHAGDPLKVSEAHTPNFCFLITPVTAGPASPGRHAEPERLIYQSSRRVASIFLSYFLFFFAGRQVPPPHTHTHTYGQRVNPERLKTNSASGANNNKWLAERKRRRP